MPTKFPVIAVLDADPELAEGLDPESFAVARRHALARVRLLPAGEWFPADEFAPGPPQLGLLVLDGLLTRDLTFVGRTTTELLGAGDLLRPWDEDDESDPISPDVGWFVHEQARIAVLDRRFALVAGRWPVLVDALVGRTGRRTQWLAFQLAISQVTRVDGRLLTLFWHLADRWGRVAPDGVRLPLQLTHQTLGKLVGARRPSVTTALTGLARDGFLERTESGWLLHGDPHGALERLLGHGVAAERSESGAALSAA